LFLPKCRNPKAVGGVRRDMRRLTALVLLGALVLGACGDDDGDVSTDTTGSGDPTTTTGDDPSLEGVAADLHGRSFVSQSVTEDGVDRPLVADTEIRVDFEDDHIAASAGCNRWSARYTVEDQVLGTLMAGTTEMGCDGPRHEQDEWLFGFLGSSPEIALEGDELTVTDGATVIRLLDREVADPDQALIGTRWELETIVEGTGPTAGASNVAPDVEAWIELSDDGTVEVHPGCNTGNATYEVDGDVIAFGALSLTRRRCPGAADDTEAMVVEILGEALTYEIEADVLRLRSAQGGLDLRAAA
jgi:heat shock protein HslJ